MLLEAPFNEDLLRLPLLAANAAPAAICCFLDFAGMMLSFPCSFAARADRGRTIIAAAPNPEGEAL